MTMEKVVLERKPYEPWVAKQGDQLTYHLPVESGFASLLFTFAITADHLAVLKADDERYYFLFAVLHRRYQMQNPASAPKVDRHFDRVLFGDIPDVERLLNLQDAEGNGAVSNLIRITMGREQAPMLSGQWFISQ
ncbi:hypothetical protein [Aliiroseovarius lamellibrachiae]|uniref:hypothetical protein n=1 Tax=Aliiroseovarius lamellibrachiae TaxID=1924933 RepID=UPI001BDFBA63|nr:hypothetical protein [Aliiroseovarius lamellibrachiae]MBT2131512.1 hypothetical protein [Aliiroseovarius lamellibrachiae]